jgi:hypothetical protein
MRSRIALALAAAAAVALALMSAPASAVVNGRPDHAGAYPYVGTLIISVPAETDTVQYHYWCSGTMVSPTVLLAAGHCFDQQYLESVFGVGSEIRGMTLDADASGYMDQLPASLRTGEGFKAPGWPGKAWKLDVGVYVLGSNDAYDGPLPTLPSAGQLDTMSLTGQQATIVGYGMTRDRTGGSNGFSDLDDGYRTYAPQRITAVTPTTVHLLGNIAAGGSGPCAGDSGAPRLVDVGGSPMIMAISHWAGPYCQTPEQALRLDTPTILGFIDDHIH